MTLRLVVLLLSVIGGVSYLAADSVMVSDWARLAWKVSGVGGLALYAAFKARSRDGALLTIVMALGALGDGLLNAFGLTIGAMAFLAGHLVAITLYVLNARPGGEDRFPAGLFVAFVVAAAWALPQDRALAPGVALYSTGLAAMAASAWLSRYPRALTGIGAMAFVASDLLIFAHTGPLAGQVWVSPAIWALYYGGQLGICLGVSRNLMQTTEPLAVRL